jgi:hypothetical protein
MHAAAACAVGFSGKKRMDVHSLHVLTQAIITAFEFF